MTTEFYNNTTYVTKGCRRSNDPISTALQLCNRTEYRCADSSKDDDVSRTIHYEYTVQYKTMDDETILLYLQDTILEHVAYGLNLAECRRKRRTLVEGTTAVTSSPRDSFVAPPSCKDDACTGSILGGITVWAADEPSVRDSAMVAEKHVLDVMDLLEEPGIIERVEFKGFVNNDERVVWYQNRTIQYGAAGGGLLLLLLLSACVICCVCCCRRNKRRRRKTLSARWQSLDEEQPIAQRDSLALRPQCSWMLRKVRNHSDGAVSVATGDLTNDQHHQSCGSDSDGEELVDANKDLGLEEVHSSATPTDIAETDPYILHEVSDDDSEVVAQWRKLHSLEAESTEEYDEEIIEVLGHIHGGDHH